jgi:hypothetical protein
VLLAIRHLAGPLDVASGVTPFSRHEQPPNEDQQTSKIELVEISDMPHEVPVDGHLMSDIT